MTQIYLAYSTNPGGVNTLMQTDIKKYDLGLLASFFYIQHFNKSGLKKRKFAKTILDSGAFSAWNIGQSINIENLISEAQNNFWQEIIALDVIGNPDLSLKNAEYMKNHCRNVMPVFHIGEPFDLLRQYCKDFRRVGLSCRFGEPISQSFEWLDECFGRTYPHRFHSFGCMNEKMLIRFPFDSVDASTWINPMRFGSYKKLGAMPYTNNTQTLEIEIDYFKKLQKQLMFRWSKEIKNGYIGD